VSPALIIVAVLVLVAGASLVMWRQPVLAFAGRTVSYVRSMRDELTKVSWPTWEDLRKSTMVIIAFVIMIGILIGIMDFVFSKLLIDVLGRAFG
jgi:preprotein translocase subunit SecE